MRKILPIFAVVAITGCSGMQSPLRKLWGKPSRDVPVVTDKPSLSERRQTRRALEDRQAYKSMTRVEGELTR